jgi:sphinganine-1-phosphate aldolase
VVERFAEHLAEAVAYAKEQHAAGEPAFSGALYGGVAGGLTDEADEFIRSILGSLLDTQQSLPPR